MSKQHYKQVGCRLPVETVAALEAIKVESGIPVIEQLRRAIQLWLEYQETQAAALARGTRKTR